MIDLAPYLPFWASGSQILKWARAMRAAWKRWEDRLLLALAQAAISTCSSAALAEHARGRDVPRFPGEPESQWRSRVLHAFTARLESGSKRGLETILIAHGVVNFSVVERPPGQDWDVMLIELNPAQLSADSDVLTGVFAQWGRACRRYAPAYSMTASGAIAPLQDNASFIFASAS